MKTLLGILLVAALGATAWMKLFPATPAHQIELSLQGQQDGVDRTDQVRRAFAKLAAACPAVQNAKSAVVTYDEGPQTYWRGEKLGWKSDIYFNVDDSQGSGHHHHFYLRQDGPAELVIDGKQVTLDWCGITGTMKDYYLLAL